MANTTPIVTTVTKPVTNPKDADATPRVNIQELCEEYYEDIIPIIIDKVRHDKRKEVHARFDFKEGSRERRTREDSYHLSARAQTTRPERLKVRDRLRYGDHQLGHRRQSRSRPRRLDTSNEDCPEDRKRFCGIRESCDDFYSHSYHDRDRSRHIKRRRDNKSPLSSVSKSDSSDERYRKSKSKRHKPMDEDDLTNPWMCKEEDPFTPRIRVARVWFDELPLESVDSYKDLKAAFLAYFMQQKKYVKDPIEIHNIKQKDGETIKDFMERFKVETGHMKGALDTMEEMMITTTAFIRGEAVAASKKKGHTSWRTHDQSKSQTLEKRSNFRESLSPYNGIIGRPGIKEIQAVPSTAHGMLKFSVGGGIVTICSTILIPAECTTVITSSSVSKEVGARLENFKVALHLDFPDQEVAIGGTLSAKGRTELCSILKENLDIFAWQPSNMTGVPRSVAEHQLNIREGYLPVRQKKRGQAPKRAKAIQAEVQKLVEARIIREPVRRIVTPFQKSTGKFNLSAATLSSVSWTLTKATTRYNWQSQMKRKLLSTPAKGCIATKKCLSASRTLAPRTSVEGVFLGYVVTLEGIKSCSDKTVAVLQLPSPRTIKEVQSLNGKLASLNRFLSKSAEKSLPLFKILKKCIKNSNFHWTAEVEQAFKQLKRHLSELPLFVVPKPKEELIVYLFATYGAINGSDTGLILTSPEGTEFTYALRFQFAASNNKAEYEALIAGIRIATQMGVQNLNLDLLEERREHAAIYEAKARLKMTKYYNARVRSVTFRPGDFVYHSNDASHAMEGGKLGPKWEGPYEVTEALGDGAYKLRSMDKIVLPGTWNIANLKRCYL
uniref:Reverse transcriptase domain-containing protein n=1 Tax=Tanacetum cinerariifolium TaxID=118510 RepID=A0A6L2KCC3_TANCI|nr:reverse transcriptase domain-containing protein [Tanacetum cinerariifolium]